MKKVCKYCPRSAVCLGSGEERWHSIGHSGTRPRIVYCYQLLQTFVFGGPLHEGVYEFELPKELI